MAVGLQRLANVRRDTRRTRLRPTISPAGIHPVRTLGRRLGRKGKVDLATQKKEP